MVPTVKQMEPVALPVDLVRPSALQHHEGIGPIGRTPGPAPANDGPRPAFRPDSLKLPRPRPVEGGEQILLLRKVHLTAQQPQHLHRLLPQIDQPRRPRDNVAPVERSIQKLQPQSPALLQQRHPQRPAHPRLIIGRRQALQLRLLLQHLRALEPEIRQRIPIRPAHCHHALPQIPQPGTGNLQRHILQTDAFQPSPVPRKMPHLGHQRLPASREIQSPSIIEVLQKTLLCHPEAVRSPPRLQQKKLFHYTDHIR